MNQWDELLKIQLFMDYIIITSHSSELNISRLCNSTTVSCAHPGYNVYTNEYRLHILHKLLPIDHTAIMALYCKQHFHTCSNNKRSGLMKLPATTQCIKVVGQPCSAGTKYNDIHTTLHSCMR